MRIKLVRQLTSFLFFSLFIGLCSCTSQERRDFESGKAEASRGHYRIAVSHFAKVIKRNQSHDLVVESLRESARIYEYEIKDPKKAIEANRLLIDQSTDVREREIAQHKIATLTFDSLQDYQKAIIEFSRVLIFLQDPVERQQVRLNLARSHFYLNNFFQAHSEIDELLKESLGDQLRFSAMQLKGNIFLAEKKFKEAIGVFTELLEEHPERALKENIALTLAVSHEENNDYKSAIKVLESLLDKYTPREYIELRIKRLLERQKNAPGARGFRK